MAQDADAGIGPSAVPPIEFDELPASLADVLRPRVERLGYLGEFTRRAAHQPEALRAFHDFTEASKDALGQALTEVVALTASVKLRNDYERNQHERLSVAQGRGRDWVAAAEWLEPQDVGVLTQQECEAHAVVLAVLEDYGHGSRSLVEAYAARHGAPAAVALLLVVSRYLAHAAVVNALEIEPPVPSIFEDGVDGG